MCDWIYRILNIKSSRDSSIKPLHNCSQNENCIPMTTYVLGKEFFECHKDIEVSTFALWAEKHHAQWYRINKETIKTTSLVNSTFVEISFPTRIFKGFNEIMSHKNNFSSDTTSI